MIATPPSPPASASAATASERRRPPLTRTCRWQVGTDNRSPARPRSTIELADGTLVSVYCFANASEINATMAGGAKAKAAPHIGVLRWRLP